MRKEMQKEVQFTNVTFVEVKITDGVPALSDPMVERFLGKLTEKKAERILEKQTERKVMITDLKPEKVRYEMTVADFIKYADRVTE